MPEKREEDMPDIEPPPGLPITDPHVVMAFDDDELAEGYMDGRKDAPRPTDNRSLAYRHGWWKGMRDGGHRKPTPDDIELVRSMYKARLNPFARKDPLHA